MRKGWTRSVSDSSLSASGIGSTGTFGEERKRKFVTSRSRSAETLKEKKQEMEKKKQARQKYDSALRDLSYCVGNECKNAVKEFCMANKLDKPESVELMKFIRYTKEKGLIPHGQSVDLKDVNLLCTTWLEGLESSKR